MGLPDESQTICWTGYGTTACMKMLRSIAPYYAIIPTKTHLTRVYQSAYLQTLKRENISCNSLGLNVSMWDLKHLLYEHYLKDSLHCIVRCCKRQREIYLFIYSTFDALMKASWMACWTNILVWQVLSALCSPPTTACFCLHLSTLSVRSNKKVHRDHYWAETLLNNSPHVILRWIYSFALRGHSVALEPTQSAQVTQSVLCSSDKPPSGRSNYDGSQEGG